MARRSGGPGRWAVVSGATGSIGSAVAAVLRADGYRVVGLCRSVPPEASPDVERFVRCDVRSAGEVEHARDSLAGGEHRLGALVNCAGVMQRLDAPGAAPTSDVIDVNLTGVMRVCEAFAPLLRAQRGAIVNVSSMLAARPVRGTAAYAASKAGLEAYSRTLALECAPEVRVNVVRPALVATDIWAKQGLSEEACGALAAGRAAKAPLRRGGVPGDVAEAVRFLVSDAASWVTGSVLCVDGGAAL